MKREYSEAEKRFMAWYEEMRKRAHDRGILLPPLSETELYRFVK